MNQGVPRRLLLQAGASLSLDAVVCDADASGADRRSKRGDWMVGRWGLMVHWIPPGPFPKNGPRILDAERAIDAFQVDSFVAQLARTNAKWLIFTIGQNTGFYSSPNDFLDEASSRRHTSRRDLPKEIIEGLKSIGIKVILYLPAEVRAVNSLHNIFKWNPSSQFEFEVAYTEFIKVYARRYGYGCSGWWLDGCYDWTAFPNKFRHWDLWFDACRAGNPGAVVALNNGCFYAEKPWPVSSSQDFLSGEANFISPRGPILGQKISGDVFRVSNDAAAKFGCLPHVLAPIDCGGRWGYGQELTPIGPLYKEFEIRELLERCRNENWAATLNVGIYQEGTIAEETLALLANLD